MPFTYNPFTKKMDKVINGYTKDEVDTISGSLQDQIDNVTTMSGVLSDHSLLSNLNSDDHTQYLLVNGNRQLTNNWNYGSYDISGTGDFSAVDGNFSGDISTGSRIIESIKSHGTVSSGIETFDLSDGSYHTITVSGDFTTAFDNWPVIGVSSITIKLTNAGSHTITWPGTVSWSDGSEPTWTTLGTDFAIFFSDDSGVTIYGNKVSQIITNHSDLGELDYASSGHTGFQPAGDYATTAQLTTISGDIISQIPSLVGYATESFVTTVSGDLQTNINGKSDLGHTHDDRYYTESEIITISGDIVSQIPSAYTDEMAQDAVGNIMTGAGTVVVTYDDTAGTITVSGVTVSGGSAPTDHSSLVNLDYALSGHTGFQPAGDYATTAQLTTISGDIISQIPSDFDDRYYTEIEITTISGDIIAQIPSLSGYVTESYVTTVSGDLQTAINGKAASDHNHSGTYEPANANIQSHISSTENPHSVDETDILPDQSGNSGKYLTTDGTNSSWTTVSGGTGTSDHSELVNLDYASAGHTGFQPAGDYITDTVMTTISGNLVDQIPTDYYTQSEVDNLTWTEDDITDLGDYATNIQLVTTSGDIVSQIPDVSDYITDTEVTTISGDIVSQIPSDYISDSEMTTISGDIVAQIGEGGVTNHSELNELDYASAGHTGFQPAGDYVTNTEMTTISGNIVNQFQYPVSYSSITSGTTYIDSFSDTYGHGCIWHYVVYNTGNARTGTVMSAWDPSSDTITYTDNSTSDVGNTDNISLGVDINSNNVRFYCTITSSGVWSINGDRFLY